MLLTTFKFLTIWILFFKCSFVDQIEESICNKSGFILNLRKNVFVLEETNLSSDVC